MCTSTGSACLSVRCIRWQDVTSLGPFLWIMPSKSSDMFLPEGIFVCRHECERNGRQVRGDDSSPKRIITATRDPLALLRPCFLLLTQHETNRPRFSLLIQIELRCHPYPVISSPHAIKSSRHPISEYFPQPRSLSLFTPFFSPGNPIAPRFRHNSGGRTHRWPHADGRRS